VIVLPLLATAVALVFGVHLLMRFARRRAPHEGLWSIAMLMYAGASAALALGVLDGWSAAEFRVYWLLGAVLTVPYLAGGELYLLVRERRWIAHAGLVVLALATVWAVAVVGTASVDSEALTASFPGGGEVLGDGTLPHRLAPSFVWPTYAFLIVGTLWSASRMREDPRLRDRFTGTALIATGATIVAIGSGVGAVTGNFALFSASLAAGAAVTYWGFLVATRRRGS
jgi:hypothetical protein